MRHNPFDIKLEVAKRKVNELSIELSKVRAEYDWFERVNLAQLTSRRESLQNEFNDTKKIIDSLRGEIAQIVSDIQLNNLSSGWSVFSPTSWFTNSEAKDKSKKLHDALGQKRIKVENAQDSLRIVERRLKNCIIDIEKYQSFNFDEVSCYRSSLARQLLQQKKTVSEVLGKKSKVDKLIAPIVKQIKESEERMADALSEKELAQALDYQLSSASNSYEKAMVHQRCDDKFGTGSPRAVISRRNNDINRIERDIQKQNKRIQNIIEKASRDIKYIIIDGNNLCYEGGVFLGLKALEVVVPCLSKNYDMTLVFDASIRSMLNRGDEEIRSNFGDNVNVHIVASSVKADETIIDIASSDKETFILSNDRYAEFRDKDAIRDDRVIRHEIVSGRIIIHDLDVVARYS